MKRLIEPCTGFTLRCASNNRVQPLGQIRLYVRLHDLIVPFYFGIMRNFPQTFLIGTTFCDRYIASIQPGLKNITPKASRPLSILAFNENTVSSIHTPQPLTPHQTMKEHVNLCLTATTKIEPYSQCLVSVSASVDGLFTIETHPNLYHTRSCHLANGVSKITSNQPFYVLLLNRSDKPKQISRHTRVLIVTTAPSVLYHQTSITEDVDHQAKESVEDHSLNLKSPHTLTVGTLATLKAMRIRDPTQSLTTVVY